MQWKATALLTVLLMASITPSPSYGGAAVVQQKETSVHPDARDYFKKLSDDDKGNIYYVISTLGNHGYLSLLVKKSTLERRGNATGRIHPFRYMHYVFSDKHLRDSFGQMSGRPWSQFSEEFSESFEKAEERNNISDDILKDFCKSTGLDYSQVKAYVDDSQWLRFMHFLHDQA